MDVRPVKSGCLYSTLLSLSLFLVLAQVSAQVTDNNLCLATMAIATETVTATTNADKTAFEANKYRQPLKLQGALDQYESFDVTPVIGKEFPTASLKQWLKAPSSDELLRDLAITGRSQLQFVRSYTNPAHSLSERSSILSKAGWP